MSLPLVWYIICDIYCLLDNGLYIFTMVYIIYNIYYLLDNKLYIIDLLDQDYRPRTSIRYDSVYDVGHLRSVETMNSTHSTCSVRVSIHAQIVK
jgi:hypothetical protein